MGQVVGRVREALMETAALLDEIVVIDSDSTDATHEVATAAGASGAPLARDPARPRHPPRQG